MRIYQIFVDRFSTGDPNRDAELAGKTGKTWMGGNLRGVISKLDYIESLGFDAIWLTPIYRTSAYHGYHITDFFDVDPHFGTKDDLRLLVREAHRRSIRVILDFVPNHISSEHPFFRDAQRDPRSEYRDWFVFTHWPDKYLCYYNIPEIPKLNLYNPDAENHVLDAAEYWVDEFGIDGYRIDHVVEPPWHFWRDLVRALRKYGRDFLLLPELWASGAKRDFLHMFWFLQENPLWLRKMERLIALRGVGDVWVWKPHVYNPWVERFLIRVFKYFFNAPLDFVTNFYARRALKLGAVPDVRVPRDHFVFLDNHDMDRLSWIARGELYWNALEWLASVRNSVVYYGAEVCAQQRRSINDYQSYGDVEARRFMDWSAARNGTCVDRFRELFSPRA